MATSTATVKSTAKSTTRFPVGLAVLWLIVLVGAYAAFIRFSQGLGAATNLSDARPWGLWIALDVMSGVALAAGGFTLAAVFYIFRLKRFQPFIRPTLLTAFLGYVFAAGAIIFDLGFPLRFYHPFFYWNIHSVMFEVAWCVLTYIAILGLENSAPVLERFKLDGLLKIVKWLTIPAVVGGIVLSTMHQSSLGGLFLLVPDRLHGLWYTPFLPVFFFISAILAGLAVIIFESSLSGWAYNRKPEIHLLSEVGTWLAFGLAFYFVVKMAEVLAAGELRLMVNSGVPGWLFIIEMGAGVLLPMLILLLPQYRNSERGLYYSAVLVMAGVVLNRFNVAYAMHEVPTIYLPSWMEVAVSAGLIALAVLIYHFMVRNFSVLDTPSAEAHQTPAHK